MTILPYHIMDLSGQNMLLRVLAGVIALLVLFLLYPVCIYFRTNIRTRLRKSVLLDRIIINSQNGIIATDKMGRIQEFNPGAERIFGYSREEILGHSLEKLIPESDRDDLLNAVEKFREDLKFTDLAIPLSADIYALHKEGMEIPVRILIGLETDLSVISVMDISKEKKRAEELEDARNKAEEANRAKSDFLNNVSHELRTPLHAILSFSSFGISRINKSEENQSPVPAEKLLEYFNNIQISAHRQLRLVNDLLDLSKLEAGKMQFQFRSYDILTVFDQIKSSLHSLFKEKNITIVTEVPDEARVFVMDPERMGQVITNLFSNAIRFSPEGSTIFLRAKILKLGCITGSSRNWIEISVEDQGPGVDRQELPHLFDKFYQSKKPHPGGTGLGLAICRQIIEGHGGTISADIAATGGAVFRFRVPENAAINDDSVITGANEDEN